MCGRYTLRSRGGDKFYGVPASELPFLAPRYNIAPSQDVPVILERVRLDENLLSFNGGSFRLGVRNRRLHPLAPKR